MAIKIQTIEVVEETEAEEAVPIRTISAAETTQEMHKTKEASVIR